MNIVTHIKSIVLLASAVLILAGCEDASDEYNHISDLYVVNTDASGLRQISFDFDYISDIEFLPDGSGIIFEAYGNMSGKFIYDMMSGEMTSYQEENPDSMRIITVSGEIYLLTAGDTDTVNISNSTDRDYAPLLINGNTQVIYLTCKYDDEMGSVTLLQMVDLTTGESQTIATLQAFVYLMEFSDNRSLIVYMQDLSPFAELWLFRATTLSISEICATYLTYTVDFSPDETSIVLDAVSGNNKELFLVNVDSGVKFRLTESEGNDLGPFFTPDGSQIVFEYRYQGQSCLKIIDRDGNNLLSLTPEYQYIYDYCLSPDGKMVAFVGK